MAKTIWAAAAALALAVLIGLSGAPAIAGRSAKLSELLSAYAAAYDAGDYAAAAHVGDDLLQRGDLGLDFSEIVALRLELAGTYALAGRKEDALALYEDVISWYSAKDPAAVELIEPLEAAAAIAADLRKSAKAAAFQDRALALSRSAYGAMNPARLYLLERAEATYAKAGQRTKAANAAREKQAIAERLEPSDRAVAASEGPLTGTSPNQPAERELVLSERSDKSCGEAGVKSLGVDVFFATTRKDTGAQDPARRFANAADPTGKWSYGLSEVSVPCNRSAGEITRPGLLDYIQLDFSANEADHFILKDVQIAVSEGEFFEGVRSAVGQTERKEAFVFIHGFNTNFEGGIYRTAQMAADLDVEEPVTPILFSWPSRASLFGYVADGEELSTPLKIKLGEFLFKVKNATGATRVHLVAHSMGNRFLLEGLRELKIKNPSARGLFDEVIFAAPDVRADNFAGLFGEVRPLAKRFTLYSSRNDKALLTSSRINDTARAGGAEPPLVLAGLDTIDTGAQSAGLLGHDDFAGPALDDFRAVMWLSLAPDKRCVLERAGTGAAGYWRLAKNRCGGTGLVTPAGQGDDGLVFTETIKTLRAAPCAAAVETLSERIVNAQALQPALVPFLVAVRAQVQLCRA